jgi:hypothetical protein
MRALCLYELDRPALKRISAELEATLRADDHAELAKLLELSDALATKLRDRERLVDWFLLPDEHPDAKPLLASLRRISKKRAFTKVLESSDSALEGRLRNFDALRENKRAATLVDKLLSQKRLPWYLRTTGGTCGWIDSDKRAELCDAMAAMRNSLTPELIELLDGLKDVSGDAVLHDSL